MRLSFLNRSPRWAAGLWATLGLLVGSVFCGNSGSAVAQLAADPKAEAQQAAVKAPAADRPLDFDRDIAPLLASRCLDCHGGAEPKGGLNLARRESAEKGGESGPAFVARKLADSQAWVRVDANEMPPKKPLTDDEKQLLKRWIEGGAAWGTNPIDPFKSTTSSRAGYDWWALKPVRSIVPPKLSDASLSAGVRNPIDQFVRARLAAEGLTPSPEADRRTLARRLYFDLIGLPPTPEEVDAFVADGEPRAYERLVDRLLESPHYGERWARHWLDVVRYGETDGFERNGRRANSWYYRDWLIRALNDDMPYDRFTRLQLAGDAIEPGNPDAVHATGLLVAGVHNTVLGNNMMRLVARQDELEDMIGNVAQTFLGLTANCGRCHDHKFDPISQQDYYRLAAAIAGVQHGERDVVDPTLGGQVAELATKIDGATRALSGIDLPARKAILAERAAGVKTDVAPPEPIAAWNLRESLKDQIGSMHLKPTGDVKVGPEGAHVAGGAYLRSELLGKPLRQKTLEAWVKLDNLTQSGGGVVSLQTPDGNLFDAIVYGEREPAKWMAGSNGFVRTQSFSGLAEADAAKEMVQFAIAYDEDGTIRGYRNGQPYGQPYRSVGLQPFAAGKAVVLIGCRHEPPGGNRMLGGTIVNARLYDRALAPAEIEASAKLGGVYVSEQEIVAKLTDVQRRQRESLRAELAKFQGERARLETRMRHKAYVVVSQAPPETRLLRRGDVTNPADIVAPGGIAAVSSGAPEFGMTPEESDGQRRRQLAEWITRADNPLFARVIVNRVWHHHFGVGIVETPSDFGFNGGRPSHPELLDWLAGEFVAQGYRLKSLHRLIVNSATYRQASRPRPEALAKDADNRLLWRRRPLRLEGETLRDSLLVVAGQLNRETGGPGFSDYKVIDAGNGTAYYEPFDPTDPASQRRSVYRFTPRGGNQGFLDLFDCPDPSASAPRRNATTTPLQALALWNGEFSLRMAATLAERVDKELPQASRDRVARVYRLTLQRAPTDAELEAAGRLVEKHGTRALCRALLNSNEFLTAE